MAKLFSYRLPFGLEKHDSKESGKYEPIIILAVTFLIGFCLKSFVSDAIWDKVLSSPLWKAIK